MVCFAHNLTAHLGNIVFYAVGSCLCLKSLVNSSKYVIYVYVIV